MKIALIVLGAVLISLVLLAILLLFSKVTLIAGYEGESFLRLRFGLIRIDLKKRLFSGKKTEQKEKRKKKKETRVEEEEHEKGSPRDFLEFLLLMGRVFRETLVMALERISIRLSRLEFSFGADDAAKTALLYGALVNAANALFAALDHFSDFSFDPKRVKLKPDFADPAPRFAAELSVKARIIDILRIYLYFISSYEEGKEDAK